MINTLEYDKRLAKELDWHYRNNVGDKDMPIKKVSTRNKLFFEHRYRLGSYKAIKAGISSPSVMMKFGNDKFRLYGEPDNNKLFDKAKGILAGWKARSKAEMRLAKLKAKEDKRNTRNRG